MFAVPVNEPLLNGNEKKYLLECIETGWISSEGPFVSRFEEGMSKYVNRQYGIAVCNGTAALEVAIAALNIGKGDEVILPSFTIISCAVAIVRAGAIPVVVDSDQSNWNMCYEQIEKKITSKTKAIMVVHIYGHPCEMDSILDIARRHNLRIIEDASQMHGQTYKGIRCGSFGDISTFSFYSNKNITAGEGGMVLTNDEKLAQRCRSLRNLCFQAERRFVHEELGWNYRMTNMQAALGVAQLERLDSFVEKKREIGSFYQELLGDIKNIELPLAETEYSKSIYWVFGVVLKEEVSFDANAAMQQLASHKIGTRPFFWPMHQQPVFKKMGLFEEESCPVAERLAQRGFYLPSGLAITSEQQIRVSEVMHEVFK